MAAEKEDWRLLNDVEHLKEMELNPTDGEEIAGCAPDLKNCVFCFEKVEGSPYQLWFVPGDLSCCICEKCCSDFKDTFRWKKLDGWDLDWGQSEL